MTPPSEVAGRYRIDRRLGAGRHVHRLPGHRRRCSSARWRSSCWPSTWPRTRPSSPASAARRWPPPGSSTPTSCRSSTPGEDEAEPPPLHRHGVRGRPLLRRPAARAQAARDRGDGADHARRLPRPRLRAPRRRGPPRREARQPAGGRARPAPPSSPTSASPRRPSRRASPRSARCSARPPTSRPSRRAARRPGRPRTSTRSASAPTSSSPAGCRTSTPRSPSWRSSSRRRRSSRSPPTGPRCRAALDQAIRLCLEREPERALRVGARPGAGARGRAARRGHRGHPARWRAARCDPDATQALGELTAATQALRTRGTQVAPPARGRPPRPPGARARADRRAEQRHAAPALRHLPGPAGGPDGGRRRGHRADRRQRRGRRRLSRSTGRRPAADRGAERVPAATTRASQAARGRPRRARASRVARRSSPAAIASRRPSHQLGHEGQVVEREQPRRGQLAGARQVVQVAAGVLAAGRARAALGDRLAARARARPGQVEPPAAVRVRARARCRGGPAAWAWRSRSCRCPRATACTMSSTSPIPSRCRGRSSGSPRSAQPTTSRISSFSWPSEPPMATPVDRGRGHVAGRTRARRSS